MDLAKYIATAVIISPLFDSFENIWVTSIVGIAIVVALLITGMSILNRKPKQQTKKRK